MHLGKFHAAVTRALRDHTERKIGSLLENVISYLLQLAQDPANEQTSKAFRDATKVLKAALISSPLNTPPPILAAMLDSIGAREYIGEELFGKIEKVIQASGMTPQIAAKNLRELNTGISNFYKNLKAIDDAFTVLRVEYDALGYDEGELAISIPEPERPRLLSELADTAKAWDRALKPFVELTDPDHNPVQVRTISSSDWQFYLSAAPVVLEAVSIVVSQVNEMLAKIVETKKLLSEILGNGFTERAAAPLIAEADGRLNSQSRQIAEDLVERNPPPDAGRAEELKIAITRSVKFIAKEMSENVTIEVRYLPPEKTEDDDADKTARIELLTAASERIFSNMKFTPLDVTAAGLLNLPAPAEDEEEHR